MILRKMQAKEAATAATKLTADITTNTSQGRLTLLMRALACQHPPKKTSKTISNKDLVVAMEETLYTRHRTIFSR